MKFDWRSPDYEAIYQQRIEMLERIRRPGFDMDALWEYYAINADDFINDFGITFDPRNAERGLPTTIPFLLFPKQRDFINWTLDRWEGREDGLVEKSRDMGVSWLCCALAAWMWIFREGVVVGFGSRKEDYVDKIGDPDCLFWKIRTFIEYLPPEFKPRGFDASKHAPHMRIINPENGSVIKGEAGDNIGRGGRTSIYFKDEAQPMHSRILTPTGWRTMSDMAVGADVVGPDGLPRKVIGINEAGEALVYRIGFSDGSFAECSENHLWAVDQVWGKRERKLLRTHEIAASFCYRAPSGQVQYRFRVPVCAQVQFAKQGSLPIDPYVLGALIGDGSFSAGQSSVTFTSADHGILSEMQRRLPAGYSLVRTGSEYGYRIASGTGSGCGKRRKNHVLLQALIDIGLRGRRSVDKFIPERYKLASPAERLLLLQGLMDTDGSGSGGVASFHTCSAQLAEDVLFIVQSLGGTATHNVKPDARGYIDMHVLHLAMPEGMVPFKLARKIEALRPRKHPRGRTIISVEPIGVLPVRCISVDEQDGLYLTDNFIVTHNCAFYERPEVIDAALSQTSNCKIDVSTPNGAGNPFYRKRHGGKIPVFIFDWKDDPRKDEAWYKRQCETLDPVVVAQEIDRNYESSVVNALIPGELVTEAMKRGPADVSPNGGLRIGIDVARFGDDSTVIAVRRGRVLLENIRLDKLDVTQVAARARVEIDKYGEPPEQIAVDTIGIGAGVADIMRGYYPDRYDKTGKKIQTVVDVNAAERMSNGAHYNMRAYMWAEMKEWLKTASIPNDQDLRVDLTALRYSFRGGEMLLESKDDAKKRGVKSPDCFVAGTLISTPNGDIPIELLSVGDAVITPFGKRIITKTWESETSSITNVIFSNGAELSGKGSHTIFTWDNKWVRLDSLSLTNEIESISILRMLAWKLLNLLCIQEKSSGFKRLVDTINQDGKIQRKDFYTGVYGLTSMVKFLKASRFTTRIMTGLTTIYQTSNLLILSNTCKSICLKGMQLLKAMRQQCKLLILLGKKLLSGMDQKRVLSGIRLMERKYGPIKSQLRPYAQFATPLIKHSSQQGRGSVLTLASKKKAINEQRQRRESALGVKLNLFLISIGLKNAVPETVLTKCVPQPVKVYNLTLDRDNIYYANGVLVSNCGDALALTFAKPTIVSTIKPAKVAGFRPLDAEIGY